MDTITPEAPIVEPTPAPAPEPVPAPPVEPAPAPTPDPVEAPIEPTPELTPPPVPQPIRGTIYTLGGHEFDVQDVTSIQTTIDPSTRYSFSHHRNENEISIIGSSIVAVESH